MLHFISGGAHKGQNILFEFGNKKNLLNKGLLINLIKRNDKGTTLAKLFSYVVIFL
jgi:hypothetical protein